MKAIMRAVVGCAGVAALAGVAAPALAQEVYGAPTLLAPDPWSAAPDARERREIVAPPRRDRLFLSYGPRFIWGDPAERDYARESRNQPGRETLRLEREPSGARYRDAVISPQDGR